MADMQAAINGIQHQLNVAQIQQQLANITQLINDWNSMNSAQ
jgi:hypothetical protein